MDCQSDKKPSLFRNCDWHFTLVWHFKNNMQLRKNNRALIDKRCVFIYKHLKCCPSLKHFILCRCNMQMSPRDERRLVLFYLTFVVALLSGMQGSCAATAVDPWLDPDDPWPWAWPWESLLWEMDSFFFRGRPFRLGAGGGEATVTRTLSFSCFCTTSFSTCWLQHLFWS